MTSERLRELATEIGEEIYLKDPDKDGIIANLLSLAYHVANEQRREDRKIILAEGWLLRQDWDTFELAKEVEEILPDLPLEPFR